MEGDSRFRNFHVYMIGERFRKYQYEIYNDKKNATRERLSVCVSMEGDSRVRKDCVYMIREKIPQIQKHFL